LKINLIVVAVCTLALLTPAKGVNFVQVDNSDELVEVPVRLLEGIAYADGVG